MRILLLLGVLSFIAPRYSLEAQVYIDGTQEAYQEYQQGANYIASRVNAYVKLMDLSGWHITLKFDYEHPTSPGTTASSHASPEYRQATVYFWMNAFFLIHTTALEEEIIRHELMHLKLWLIGHSLSKRYQPGTEAWEMMMMLRETVATNLSRMEVWKQHEPDEPNR